MTTPHDNVTNRAPGPHVRPLRRRQDQEGQLRRARGLLDDIAALPVYERALALQRPTDSFFRPTPPPAPSAASSPVRRAGPAG